MSCAAPPADADSPQHDASNLRRPLAVCLVAALALAAAPRAHAAPPPTPDNVHAIVQYNPARPILVNWDDVAGETTYDIQRSIGGAPFQSIITMPADVTQFNDFDSMTSTSRISLKPTPTASWLTTTTVHHPPAPPSRPGSTSPGPPPTVDTT